MAAIQFLDLARQRKAVEGRVLLSALPRLVESLLALGVSEVDMSTGHVQYQLEGLSERYFGEQSLPMLGLTFQASLPLVCQRCFAPMPLLLDLHFDYAVCHDAPEALLEDEEVDWINPEEDAALECLLEDELLMALPIAVMHEQLCTEVQQSAGEKTNPFAVLAKLKKQS